MVDDVEGAKNIQKTQDTIGSMAGASSILFPYMVADFAAAAGTYGLGHAIAAEGASAALGTAGYYGGEKLGKAIDDRFDTNVTP